MEIKTKALGAGKTGIYITLYKQMLSVISFLTDCVTVTKAIQHVYNISSFILVMLDFASNSINSCQI